MTWIWMTVSRALSCLGLAVYAPAGRAFSSLNAPHTRIRSLSRGSRTRMSSSANKLGTETSPYLLQHAQNPVHWLPWGAEAFKKATSENKPIFLSVGYSSCHWCHVMEKESFESEKVAEVLNQHFVPIKVDREERPDVDELYMTFVQATTGGGGWPMSVWLTPALKPFVGATYFPEDRLLMVLKSIQEKWESDPQAIVASGDEILAALQERLGTIGEGINPTSSTTDVPLSSPNVLGVVKEGVRVLEGQFDKVYGGFGRGLKFPQPSRLSFLMAAFKLFEDAVLPEGSSGSGELSHAGQTALEMALLTLDGMQKGGINDHILGGFARYSTDPRHHVPHFEKMLYDNAQLATSYLEAYQLTADEEYLATACSILDYVKRDMTSPEGGFYSAQDADSYPHEGAKKTREGAFQVFTKQEISQIFAGQPLLEGRELATSTTLEDLICFVYGVEDDGNCDPRLDPHGELEGQNHFYLAKTPQEAIKELGLSDACSLEEVEAALERGKGLLRDARRARPAPFLDDKIIVAWNGLMISAFAKAAQVLGDKGLGYLQAGTKAAQFIRTTLYSGQGLGRTARAGIRSSVNGFADDYSFLIRGLIDLYEAELGRGDGGLMWLEWAKELQGEMDAGFGEERGGVYAYYSTRKPGEDRASGEGVLLRLRCQQDAAEPSAQSVAAGNLLRLAQYYGDEALASKGEALLAAAVQDPTTPGALPELLGVLCGYTKGIREIVVSQGSGQDELIGAAKQSFRMGSVLALAQSSGTNEGAGALQRSFKADGDKAAAYICDAGSKTCSRPITNPLELMNQLS